MEKFLLISAREGAEVLAAEYADFKKSAGLRQWELDQVILDSHLSTLPDLSPYAGVFIGGSPFNITNARPTPGQIHIQQLLLQPFESDVPAFYICFGNSLISQHLGGTVGRKHPEQVGGTWVELTDAGVQDPLLRGLPRRFTSLTGHTESVDFLPKQIELLATGPTCPVQMFRANETTWSSQFHADMDPEAMKVRMAFYRSNGYFNNDEFDQVVAHVAQVETKFANLILRNFVRYCRRQAAVPAA